MRRKIQDDYIERVYAGWLGKVIGVRHGANIEHWPYDRVQKAFGEITGYVHQFKNFAADDDTNGPIFFLRALEDYTHTRDITPEEMGLTWLNYAADGHGFFWWGGYGKSTEHTAYLNLKSGIMAPQSGSIEQNGITVAEQIGGQIFIDVWGLIAPGDPKLAAEYAEKSASVSHDGNGKYGGMFIAACIAAAFQEKNIERILESGLSVIPKNCEYAIMVRDVIQFYKEHPEDWRVCFKYLFENLEYDRHFPKVSHITPNSAIIILALLYGEGDFSDAINICNMCGWDTDCNVANVGTIMGVRNGLEGIDMSWRKPINDFLCCSSVIGSMNILDLPWCASYISNLGYKVAGEEPPEKWADILSGKNATYHFEYPGSTHAFRVESDHKEVSGYVKNTDEYSFNGQRSLKVIFDNCNGGYGYRAYVKTYYTPEDFDDNRYEPSFSPILYPGQEIDCQVMLPEDGVKEVKARLYIMDRNEKKVYYGEERNLILGDWVQLKFSIPHMRGVCIERAGVEFIPVQEESRKSVYLPSFISYIDQFNFSGLPSYEVDFNKECIEQWSIFQKEVSQLTYLRGIWTIENGELSGSYHAGSTAEAYTGSLEWENYIFGADVIPKIGDHHHINFRVQGGIRSYAVGLTKNNKLALYKNDNGYTQLALVNFNWTANRVYTISVKAIANNFAIMVDGVLILEYTDRENPYLNGQVGFSNFNGSHTHYKGFVIRGIEK